MAVRKPVSTFIPSMAALLLVGVVLVSELVDDAAPLVGVVAVVPEAEEVVPVFVVEEEVADEEEPELMLNWLD